MMCGEIDCYLQMFSSLRTDRNRKRWSVFTGFQAPHKPLLLLSILDLIAAKIITRNFIEPSLELVETFNDYWNKIMPLGTTASMSYPFYHLRSASFWQLISQPRYEDQGGRTVSSVKRLKKLYHGAKFAKDLFPLLLRETSREKFRSALVSTYFDSAIQPVLLELSVFNYESEFYSQRLLMTGECPPQCIANTSAPETKQRVRDQGFRKAIVKLYEHRCAICGIRMLTPEGHTIVEAAHIVPWSQSHNDKPQNGMALCRLCHWSFDEGLMSVGREYEVMISRAVRKDNNFPGHMETLTDRTIFKPQSRDYWPDQNNLDIHRNKTFKKN